MVPAKVELFVSVVLAFGVLRATLSFSLLTAVNGVVIVILFKSYNKRNLERYSNLYLNNNQNEKKEKWSDQRSKPTDRGTDHQNKKAPECLHFTAQQVDPVAFITIPDPTRK